MPSAPSTTSRLHGRHLVEGLRQLRRGKINDYESFIKYQDHELVALAWLYNFNRGVIIAPDAKRSGRCPSNTPTRTSTSTSTLRGPHPRRDADHDTGP